MQQGKVNIVIDGQWGSGGKGKVAGFLSQRYRPDVAVSSFMLNAGHWYRDSTGREFMTQQIPTSALSKSTLLYLSSGSGINVAKLFDEIKMFEDAGIPILTRLKIDWRAVIIEERHATAERESLNRISSTMKGCGAALAEKVSRSPHVIIAQDVKELQPFLTDVSQELNTLLRTGATVIGETAQGFDLSLNHGTRFPFVTSRDVTPMAFLNDIGVNHWHIGDVYGVLRTFPIRVGNTDNGVSGPCYDDQIETTWSAISLAIGKNVQEKTTVTQRIRRVFTWSHDQFQRFYDVCRPSHVFLTFCDYVPEISTLMRKGIDISYSTAYKTLLESKSFEGLRSINSVMGNKKVSFSYGPMNEDTITAPIW